MRTKWAGHSLQWAGSGQGDAPWPAGPEDAAFVGAKWTHRALLVLWGPTVFQGRSSDPRGG